MEVTSRYFWEADRERWAWEHIEDGWRSWGWAETEETAKQAAVDGKHPDCVQSFRKRPTGNLRVDGSVRAEGCRRPGRHRVLPQELPDLHEPPAGLAGDRCSGHMADSE